MSTPRRSRPGFGTEPIADAYNAKYEYRPNPEETSAEGWCRLRPRRVLAWLERDYPKAATHFDLD